MGNKSLKFCTDVGSEYCPCHLAYSGDCIKCSMIDGKCECDCDWQGVCVYNLFMHNQLSPIDERKEYTCEILDKKELKKDTYLLNIDIPNKLSKYLTEPGSYIFLRDKNQTNPIYNAPISVMDVDTKKNILQVVISTKGIKTKDIVAANQVFVKAPYYNGIFGLKEIKSNQNSNCLVVLDGLSQVNSINVIKKLKRDNYVEVFVNKYTTLLTPIEEKLNDMNVKINYFDVEADKKLLAEYIKSKDVKFVYCSALVEFSKKIMNIVDSVDENIKLAVSNNNLICCGEGICGACIIDLNGKRVKTCKTQIDSREYLKYSK